MGQSVFEGFHRAIIGAHDGEKEKIESKPENHVSRQLSCPIWRQLRWPVEWI
jgi:hypothetical protein